MPGARVPIDDAIADIERAWLDAGSVGRADPEMLEDLNKLGKKSTVLDTVTVFWKWADEVLSREPQESRSKEPTREGLSATADQRTYDRQLRDARGRYAKMGTATLDDAQFDSGEDRE